MKHLIASVLLLCTVLNSGLSNAYDRVTYIHSDGQGSPIAASDDQGNLEWRAEYYPFGAEFRNTEIRRENNTSFSGKPLDEEIGLSYFGARHYDPLIGRFTSIDPVPVDPEDYLTFNRYAYANNNPYKYVDPNGELPFLIPVAIFLGKEIAAELASRATGGATDFLSARRMGTKIFKKGFSLFKGSDATKGGGNYVYRGLAEGENPAGGLVARNATASNSPISHVAGKKDTQWISTTKDINVAREKYGQHGIVRIDLNKVTNPVKDVSGGFEHGRMISNWAKKDREVLIQGGILGKAIKPVK